MANARTVFDLMEIVNQQWLKGADWYTNELPGIKGEMGPWFAELQALEYSRPFHRTTIGEDHTYFVIDIDMEILEGPSGTPTRSDDPLVLRAAKLHVALTWVRQWLDQHPDLNFFARISGSGIHLVQRYEKRIDPYRFRPIISHYFQRDPDAPIQPEWERDTAPKEYEEWHRTYRYDGDRKTWRLRENAWSKIVRVDEYKALITVDLSLYQSGSKMIRWTYSRNMKVPSRINYAIPIDKWDTDWVLEHMTREGLEKNTPHVYEIPPFQFEHLLLPSDKVHGVEGFEEFGKVRPVHYVVKVPPHPHTLSENELYIIKEMESYLLADESIVPPCVSIHYQKSKSASGVFWGRLPWIRWLANRGYTPEQVALLIRFKVNSEKDNQPENQHKLTKLLPWAYGPREKHYKIPSCDKMRDPTTYWYIATPDMCAICGRSYPTQKYGEIAATATGKPDVGFQRIQEMITEVLDGYGSENVVIKKATRAGVTTTMIPVAKLLRKKLLVVVPTNRIGTETFVKAVKLSYEKFNTTINAGMFAANKNSCLILMFLNKELRSKKKKDPTWGDAPISWLSLRYHSKPPCKKCRFRREELPIPLMSSGIPRPVIGAQMTKYSDDPKDREGSCAFTTLYNHIRDLDVVFITYAKLFAIMANFTEESIQLQQELYDSFDVLLLDEISHLTNSSPLDLKLLRSEVDVTGMSPMSKIATYKENIFYKLEYELDKIVAFFMATKESATTKRIEEYIAAFIKEYEYMINAPLVEQRTQVIRNFLEPADVYYLYDNFGTFHSLIEKVAIESNITVNTIEAVLMLLKEDFWIMSSIPTKFHPIDISFIVKPATAEVKRFVRQFDQHVNKQVIVTDATLPFVGMTDFFRLQFKEYNVGDPRLTNASQLVITDSRNVNVIDLFFSKEKSKPFQQNLIDFINMIARAHDPKNIMIVTPNRKSAFWLYDQRKSGNIPEIQMTWYRSDATIGVESDKRIIIAICPPHPPRGSNDWLAHYFKQDGLFLDMPSQELGASLCETSAKIAFYQTIGRGKDPEVQERSVVYCWGISGGRQNIGSINVETVMDLMTFDDEVPIPELFKASHTISQTEIITDVGKIWIKDGVRVDEFAARLVGIVKMVGEIDQRDLRRKLHITTQDLDILISRLDKATLGKMGVEIEDVKLPTGPITRRFRYDKNTNIG